MIHRRSFLALASALPVATLLSDRAAAKSLPLPAGPAATDILLAREALAMHPGLYLHRAPAEIAAAQQEFETRYAGAVEVGNLAAAYLALSRFLATLRCGHSYANFFNQDDKQVLALFDRSTRLPFWFRWIGDRMMVVRDPTRLALPRGTEVLVLNGRRAADVLATLLPYTRADGGNNGKRRSLLSVEGREDYETFDIFQGLLLPPQDGIHKLTVRLPSGEVRKVECAPISLAERRAMMTRVAAETDRPRWQWARRPDGVVILTMPGWAMWNSKWNWRAWLEERLDSLDDARGLVIDIRENEGGDDCGDPILARLVDRPISGWPFDLRLRFDRIPELVRKNSSTWDNNFYALGDGARPLANGYFRPLAAETQSQILPAAKRIRCPVAALIGPVNSSATFAFINAARESGRVTLIGEATGGNRRGVNGGAFLFVKLPVSGIEFDLPLKGYVAHDAAPDTGLEPDISAPVTPASLRAGTDEAMRLAVHYCLRKR